MYSHAPLPCISSPTTHPLNRFKSFIFPHRFEKSFKDKVMLVLPWWMERGWTLPRKLPRNFCPLSGTDNRICCGTFQPTFPSSLTVLLPLRIPAATATLLKNAFWRRFLVTIRRSMRQQVPGAYNHPPPYSPTASHFSLFIHAKASRTIQFAGRARQNSPYPSFRQLINPRCRIARRASAHPVSYPKEYGYLSLSTFFPLLPAAPDSLMQTFSATGWRRKVQGG